MGADVEFHTSHETCGQRGAERAGNKLPYIEVGARSTYISSLLVKLNCIEPIGIHISDERYEAVSGMRPCRLETCFVAIGPSN